MVRELIIKEKVLLHLFDFSHHKEEYEAPVEVTQQGIARAVAIRVQHVTQYVKPLLEEELLEESTRHIHRKARRRKVYFLTPKGRQQAASLREVLLKERMPFEDRSGNLVEAPLSEIYHEHRRGERLLSLLQERAAVGHISEAAGVAAGELVDFTQEAPEVEKFYGRQEELDEILRGMEDHPTIVVTGMAGMGKTTLGSRVCELVRERRSLFWRQVRAWDTPRDLAHRLASFLKALGRVELYGYLSSRGEKELGRMKKLLTADLTGLSSLLVFDDVHNASEDATAFISILHEAGKAHKESALLLLSRSVPDFYSRRDVAVERSVLEVPLRALDLESSQRLLAEAGLSERHLSALASAGGGNPLFLRLIASAGSGGTREGSLSTMETYIAEEIEPGLGDAERACLETASLYRFPVPVDGLLLEPGARRRTLIRLHRKGLLDRTDAGQFVLHDALRTYFRQGVPPNRAEKLVSRVVEWLRDKAARVADAGDVQAAITYVGNAVAVDTKAARLSSSLRLLGKLRKYAGDYAGAIEAYGAALRETEEPGEQARLRAELARCYTTQADHEEAKRQIAAGLELVSDAPSMEAAWLLQEKAGLAFERQDYDAALEEVEKVIGWLSGLPKDPDLGGHLANWWGLIHLSDPTRADYTQAQEAFQEAVNAFASIGNNASLCLAYNNLSLAELELGEVEKAMEHLNRSAEIAESIGHLPARTVALFTRARYLALYYGEYEQAEALYHETYRLAKATNMHSMLVWHYWHLAELHRYQERYEEAKESLEYFLKASGDMLNAESRVDALSLMARVCLLAGDPSAARAHLTEAGALEDEASSEHARRAVAWARAALDANEGDVDGALAAYEEAAKIPVSDFRGELLLEHGQFLASLGASEEAREVLERARHELARISKPLEGKAAEALRVVKEAS